jgi:hypothetical protein
MPAMSVFVDGELKARVCTDGLNVLAVNVGGTKIDETFATVEFSGGVYPDSGESTHLIWLSELELRPGQCVRIEVAESGSNSHVGKTLEELFPDLPEEKEGPMPSREQLVEEVRSRKHYREHFSMSVESSSGTRSSADLLPSEHGFGASFLWNWVRPERITASLHGYSLDQLKSGEISNYHFREHLLPGAWVELRIDA